MGAHMSFEDIEYFCIFILYKGSELLGLLLQREYKHPAPELKAKTHWELTGLCLQHKRQGVGISKLQLLHKGEVD